MNGMFHGTVWEAIYTAVVKTRRWYVFVRRNRLPGMFLSHLLFFFRLCFLHGQFEADGWFCGVLILPSKAILEQYEMGVIRSPSTYRFNAGREIAPYTGANAPKFFTLATKS